MRFKHSLQVFIDNIAATYKLLVYRLIVALVIAGLACAVIIPSVNAFNTTEQYLAFEAALSKFWENIAGLNMEVLHGSWLDVKDTFREFLHLLSAKGLIAADITCAVIIFIVYMFLTALGDFALGETLSNRMALRAHTPYSYTFVKDFKRACLYSLIIVPASVLYYLVCGAFIWGFVFVLLRHTPILVKLFLTSLLLIATIALKYSLTTDWIPSILHSGLGVGKSVLKVLKPDKEEFLRVVSTVVIMVLLILVINVSIASFTFGAGLIVTVPAGTMLLSCYQLVNYFDNHKMKYFVDDYVIIGPQKDEPVSREEFFKGENK